MIFPFFLFIPYKVDGKKTASSLKINDLVTTFSFFLSLYQKAIALNVMNHSQVKKRQLWEIVRSFLPNRFPEAINLEVVTYGHRLAVFYTK